MNTTRYTNPWSADFQVIRFGLVARQPGQRAHQPSLAPASDRMSSPRDNSAPNGQVPYAKCSFGRCQDGRGFPESNSCPACAGPDWRCRSSITFSTSQTGRLHALNATGGICPESDRCPGQGVAMTPADLSNADGVEIYRVRNWGLIPGRRRH